VAFLLGFLSFLKLKLKQNMNIGHYIAVIESVTLNVTIFIGKLQVSVKAKLTAQFKGCYFWPS
jgi:hypothetical protein